MNNEIKIITEKINKIFKNSQFSKTISIDFLYDQLVAYINNSGKYLRPTLCQWFCGTVNKNTQKAWEISAALEMFHTWTLVHDDIIDQDDMRRNQPSLHKQLSLYAKENFTSKVNDAKRFGKAMAILIGDLQQAWVYSLINDSPINFKTKKLIQQIFANSMTPAVLCGEALDIKFEFCNFNQISSEEIINMIELKTAKLLEFSARIGIIIGLNLEDDSHPYLNLASEYARNLGIAFQLKDDLLGIFADFDKLGKPIGSDIKNKKITLLYKKGLEFSSSKNKLFLMKIFGKKSSTQKEIALVKDILIKSKAKTFIEQKILHYHQLSLQALEKLPNKKFTLLLNQLANFLIHRSF